MEQLSRPKTLVDRTMGLPAMFIILWSLCNAFVVYNAYILPRGYHMAIDLLVILFLSMVFVILNFFIIVGFLALLYPPKQQDTPMDLYPFGFCHLCGGDLEVRTPFGTMEKIRFCPRCDHERFYSGEMMNAR